MQRKDDAIRAEVMAALLAGQSVSEVAKQLKLSKATVSRIKNTILPEQLKHTETKRRDKITDLIESHLVTALTSANELARKATTNDIWISEQSAAELAVFYGVLTDKAVRILESIQPAEEDQPEETEEDA
jgi:transposase